MKRLNCTNTKLRHCAQMLTLLVFGFSTQISLARIEPVKTESLSMKQREVRLANARELLGRHYSASVVRTGEDIQKINGFVYRWTKVSLPAGYEAISHKIAQAIIDESFKHGFDPVLVLAMIQNESQFNPVAKGSLDEIGLMQLRPGTAKWIAERDGIPWKGTQSLNEPLTNIRLGTAYLAFLRDSSDDHARLYLAAYNMGLRNVQGLLDRNKWPTEYPRKVMEYYIEYYNELKGLSTAKKPTVPVEKDRESEREVASSQTPKI